jgi:hypothetical protein
MTRIFKYAFFTSTVAYFLAAFLFFVYFLAEVGWSRIDSDIVTGLPSFLTLGLSEFKWWGDFYGLAVLVPWLGSALVLALLLRLFRGGTWRRRLWAGVSLAVYYVAMLLVLLGDKVITWWGHMRPIDIWDVLYGVTFLIWPAVGFILGGLAAFIVDKIMKPQFAV